MINLTIKKSDLIRQTKILGICLGTLFVLNHFGDFNYMSEMDEYERWRWRTHIESNSNLGFNGIAEPFVSDSRHEFVYYISYKPIVGMEVSTKSITGLTGYDIRHVRSKYSNFNYPKRLILYIKSTLVNFYLSIVLLIIYNLFIKLKKNIRVKIE